MIYFQQPLCSSADTSVACKSVTIDDDAIGIYTVTFKAVAKGGKELDAAFTFEIICSDRVVITASAALIETPATYQSCSKT